MSEIIPDAMQFVSEQRQFFALVRCKLKPGQESNYRAATAKALLETKRPPGLLVFDLVRDVDDPETIWQGELWTGRASCEENEASPAHAAFHATIIALLETRQIQRFHVAESYLGEITVDDAGLDPAEYAPFVVVGRRSVKPGSAPAVMAAIRLMWKEGQHAPGFLQTHVLCRTADPTPIWHYEIWSTQKLHDAFFDGPTHERFEASIRDELVTEGPHTHGSFLARLVHEAQETGDVTNMEHQ